MKKFQIKFINAVFGLLFFLFGCNENVRTSNSNEVLNAQSNNSEEILNEVQSKDSEDLIQPKDTSEMEDWEQLVWIYEQTKGTDMLKLGQLERLFFDKFPSSFDKFRELYGYDEESGAMPLYFHHEHITFFCSLSSIPKIEFYNKLLDISINGTWEADNIRDLGIYTVLSEDIEDMAKVMDMRTDAELISIFHFVYDGPHPDNYQDDFDKLYAMLRPHNSRIAYIMKASYEKLLAEHDGHGH
jgi:hypothetical protein